MSSRTVTIGHPAARPRDPPRARRPGHGRRPRARTRRLSVSRECIGANPPGLSAVRPVDQPRQHGSRCTPVSGMATERTQKEHRSRDAPPHRAQNARRGPGLHWCLLLIRLDDVTAGDALLRPSAHKTRAGFRSAAGARMRPAPQLQTARIHALLAVAVLAASGRVARPPAAQRDTSVFFSVFFLWLSRGHDRSVTLVGVCSSVVTGRR